MSLSHVLVGRGKNMYKDIEGRKDSNIRREPELSIFLKASYDSNEMEALE